MSSSTLASSTSSRKRSGILGTLLGTRLRRIGAACSVLMVVVLVAAAFPAHTRASGLVGPKYYYLGLGDSLAFGYQPNLDWSHGYVQQWYTNLQSHGSKSLTNYGCNGETSYTFINGGCPYAYLLHNYYVGAQLKAAVSFIKNHPGKVSPVSLDIGANDLLPDISSSCSINPNWTTDLSNLNSRLTGTILPQLLAALNGTGDLVMMNYYDPYQNTCASNPAVLTDVQTLNTDLAQDAAQVAQQYGVTIPVADVFTAFGGAKTPNPNICTYTWMCASSPNIHATTTGYGVIAGAFESAYGY
jgi:lysophospholipase L1-like esterase